MGAVPSQCRCEDAQPEEPKIVEIEAVNMEETISEGSVSQSVACTGTGKEAASVAQRKSALDVDAAIMRGISLRSTLWRAGRLWRWSPADLPGAERKSLWEHARPVDGFDIFLSHSWATRGRWKFFALSLQYGWTHVLLTWLVATLVVEILSFADILPSYGCYETAWQGVKKCYPFGAWALYISGASSLGALFLAPYLPECRKPQFCFVDVASINQDDASMMERGIYGLGGFLSASRELRILWSPPYLSRLWCVFELAAYRTANPHGTISLSPLHTELLVAAMWLGLYATMLLFDRFMAAQSIRGGLAFLPALIPLAFLFHVLRKVLMRKRQLFAELQNFDLDAVQCRKASDREFVQQAIIEWYGSLDRFTAYVRGPLRTELLADHVASRLPLRYTFIIVTPVVSMALDALVALVKGNAPLQCSLSYGLAVVLGLFTFYAMALIRFGIFLCDRFGRPAAATACGLYTFAQSLGLFVVFILAVFGGSKLAGEAYRQSLAASLAWFCVSLALACWPCFDYRRCKNFFASTRSSPKSLS